MAEYDLISKTALLRHLDMAIDCKDCPRNTDRKTYYERCACSEVADICNTITDFATFADVQPVNRWISVEDRLPEIGESVLVAIIINAKLDLPFRKDFTPDIRIGWLDDNGEWGLQFDSADRDEVLYWQPLPELPKDGEDNE